MKLHQNKSKPSHAMVTAALMLTSQALFGVPMNLHEMIICAAQVWRRELLVINQKRK